MFSMASAVKKKKKGVAYKAHRSINFPQECLVEFFCQVEFHGKILLLFFVIRTFEKPIK